jgi:transcriptional regulator with XRE-family HTH domain
MQDCGLHLRTRWTAQRRNGVVRTSKENRSDTGISRDHFLRSRRTRLSPDKGSDATRPRRRTPGLKREEVAQRAGISAEWYVKLELGRTVSPSAGTVEALGRALRLDRVELALYTRR